MKYRALVIDPQAAPDARTQQEFSNDLPRLKQWAEGILRGLPESTYVQIFEMVEMKRMEVTHQGSVEFETPCL